jgi:hypothetical protein
LRDEDLGGGMALGEVKGDRMEWVGREKDEEGRQGKERERKGRWKVSVKEVLLFMVLGGIDATGCMAV